MSASRVELCALGFVVRLEDGTYMPKDLPGRVLVFHGRIFAERFAAAVDAGDSAACRDLIASHGRWYEEAA